MFSDKHGLAAILSLGLAQFACAGYYTSIDTLEEIRPSLDYPNVFRNTLDALKSIPAGPIDPPIRRRYVLIDQAGPDRLATLEQKLNYSSVLIRRGKPDEAVQFLLMVERQHPDHFLVLAHAATAHFLGAPEFRRKAPYYMKQSLRLWPKTWADLNQESKDFLKSFGWEETAFERNRKYETYFERLVKNRVEEDKKRARKEDVPETLDPIFLDDNEKPLRFVNEKGEFEPGRIAGPKMSDDAVEIVEQLLIWMPTDTRLLWLLAEVFNARAMRLERAELKIPPIKNAYVIFKQLENPFGQVPYARAEIKKRFDILSEYEPIHKQEPPPEIELPPERDPDEDSMFGPKWRRTLGVGFIAGVAVGLFALWQLQEMRRRRAARTA